VTEGGLRRRATKEKKGKAFTMVQNMIGATDGVNKQGQSLAKTKKVHWGRKRSGMARRR